MHPTVPFFNAYKLVRRDGTTYGPYASVADAVAHFSFAVAHAVGLPGEGHKPEIHFVLRDPQGRAVDPRLVLRLWQAARKPVQAPVFRREPVAGVGQNRRRGPQHRFALPGRAERRDAQTLDAGVRPRAARVGKEARAAWFADDPYMEAKHLRSWKRHRAHQWKN